MSDTTFSIDAVPEGVTITQARIQDLVNRIGFSRKMFPRRQDDSEDFNSSIWLSPHEAELFLHLIERERTRLQREIVQQIPVQQNYYETKDGEEVHYPGLSHSMTGDGMNCLEFFDMIKKEWCVSEEQYKPFLNDVLTFARKYHKERNEYCG